MAHENYPDSNEQPPRSERFGKAFRMVFGRVASVDLSEISKAPYRPSQEAQESHRAELREMARKQHTETGAHAPTEQDQQDIEWLHGGDRTAEDVIKAIDDQHGQERH